MATRVDPPMVSDERATLVSFLDYHRETLAMKCEGLTDDQLRERAVPPSSLSLLGLVRHLADVERAWFRRRMEGADAPPRWYSAERPDDDFDAVADADVAAAFDDWRAECEHARSVTAAHDLDAVGNGLRNGEPVSLRWILVHMLEEYARHNGHADLLRERIDGATGE